jgi:hypothetical protein
VTITPGVFLALLIGSIHGALAHLLWGRHWLQLPAFWAGGIIGCLLVLAVNLHLVQQVPTLSGLPLIESTVVAWLLLGIIAAVWRA